MEAALERFLRAQVPAARDIRVESFRAVAGGYSRETFATDCVLEFEDGRCTPLRLILRRDPPPAVALLQNSRPAEHRLLNRLAEHTSIPVPRSLFLDEAGEAFERPAMLLERVSGASDISGLFDGFHADELQAVATDFCERLAQLHATPLELLDPDGDFRDPRGVGVDTSSWDAYMDSTLSYVKGNYANIAFDPLPWAYDAYCSLRTHLPAPAPLVLCHGDFQPSNFLFEGGKLTAVIDWENAHVGDPREDLGWLSYMQIITGVDIMGAVKADGGFLGHYSRVSGIPVTEEDVSFFRVFCSSLMGAPIVAAVKRRLDGLHSEFTHLYILQAVMATGPVFGAMLGYPPPEGEA
jgi:aminoglycoside phosphotransferase (APT) family kinase protein